MFIKPKAEEAENEFIARCMGSDEMQGEFPDQEQRLAVCYSKYREGKNVRDVALNGRTYRVKVKSSGDAALEVDSAKRIVAAVITTDAIDRDAEVVLPEGLSFNDYRKNPIVLFAHCGDRIVGKSLSQRMEKGKIVAETQFAETEDGDMVWSLVKQGILRGVSIGMNWRTLKTRSPTTKEFESRPDWAGCESIIEAAEVLEYSFVSIPANPDALVVTGKSNGSVRRAAPSIRRSCVRRCVVKA